MKVILSLNSPVYGYRPKSPFEKCFIFKDYLLKIFKESTLDTKYKSNPFLKNIYDRYMKPYYEEFEKQGWV